MLQAQLCLPGDILSICINNFQCVPLSAMTTDKQTQVSLGCRGWDSWGHGTDWSEEEGMEMSGMKGKALCGHVLRKLSA